MLRGPVGCSPSHSAASEMDGGSGFPGSGAYRGRAPSFKIIMISHYVLHPRRLEWYRAGQEHKAGVRMGK